MSAGTIHALLGRWAERTPNAPAILAPGRAALTYRDLRSHVERVVGRLGSAGVGRTDRVAIVLPNGPEMAVAFLAVTAGATSAPLNPAYRAPELDFYLSDLGARAVIVLAGAPSPVREVARVRGIAIVELTPSSDGPAGLFELSVGARAPAATVEFQRCEDVALVLHTSGTTSRPKIVPLTQGNVCASARHVQATLALTERDRCLNVMPLFHIHGLVGALLSSITAGASVACAPGLDEARFFSWLEAMEPTWYTAVPTMHQAVLARARQEADVLSRRPLRFIRSSSSSLPPQVMQELERVFRAPVIESYGMTEASHQMASNPLPPRARKPGSVGLAAGPEMAVMDAAGRLVPPGTAGEIVIRGPNVTEGYEGNPAANANAFTGGWFRTGDQGHVDEDGYFYITGRIKEIINRGGEKVMPREVDEVLLDHPAVAQALAFAVPHARLGEDVAAAVVLRSGAAPTELELREFAATRLAAHKVPRQIVFLEALPKGPTGKPQRIGLAEKLGDRLEPPYVAPRTATERRLAAIWARALNVSTIGVHDDFFALGGDSLLAATVLAEAFERDVDMTAMFRAPTVERLARLVEERAGRPASSLVLLRGGPSWPPVFLLPRSTGDLGELASCFGPGRPVYGVLDRLDDPSRIEDLAARLVADAREAQPRGPYLLVGICSGAALAFEMAQQLRASDEEVALLAFVEPTPPYAGGLRAYVELARLFGEAARRRLRRPARVVSEVRALAAAGRSPYLRSKLAFVARWWAARSYRPRPYAGRVHLFLTRESLDSRREPRLAWRALARGGAEMHEISSTQETMLRAGHAVALGRELDACVAAALAPAGSRARAVVP